MNKNYFEFQFVIGRGGFGKVWQVIMKKNKKKYALKEMSKVKIIDRRSIKNIKNEREFLSKLRNPFLVNMICAFQDYENLYLVMDLLTGGDLRYHLCKRKTFIEEETKFFISCLILGLEYIHQNNIIHRDIKPENLVLDEKGYVRITDFGVAKISSPDNSSETSGTPGYMAPEVLMAKNHSFPVDFYAIGIMGYEFMLGYRPYVAKNRKEMKKLVLRKPAIIDENNNTKGWSRESIDFINKCLKRKVSKRLGYANGIKELKDHPWFNDNNWEEIYNKKALAPFVPKLVGNYDKKYCKENDKIGDETLERYQRYKEKNNYNNIFEGYTFLNNELAEITLENNINNNDTNTRVSLNTKQSNPIIYLVNNENINNNDNNNDNNNNNDDNNNDDNNNNNNKKKDDNYNKKDNNINSSNKKENNSTNKKNDNNINKNKNDNNTNNNNKNDYNININLDINLFRRNKIKLSPDKNIPNNIQINKNKFYLSNLPFNNINIINRFNNINIVENKDNKENKENKENELTKNNTKKYLFENLNNQESSYLKKKYKITNNNISPLNFSEFNNVNDDTNLSHLYSSNILNNKNIINKIKEIQYKNFLKQKIKNKDSEPSINTNDNKNTSKSSEKFKKKYLNNILSFRGFSHNKSIQNDKKNKNYSKITLSKLNKDNKLKYFLPQLMQEDENDLSFKKNNSNFIKFKKRLNLSQEQMKMLTNKQTLNLSNNLSNINLLSNKNSFEKINNHIKLNRNESTGTLTSRMRNFFSNNTNKNKNKNSSNNFLNILSNKKNKIRLSKNQLNRNVSAFFRYHG